MKSVLFILISFSYVLLSSQTCIDLNIFQINYSEPVKIVNVSYGSVSARMGNYITPSQAANAPQINFDADPEKYYLLVMTDPDVPSRMDPHLRELIHWVVYDIKGGDLSTGVTCFEYAAPQPSEGSGPHRYFFMIFPQMEKLNKTCVPVVSDNFSARVNGRAEKFALEIGVEKTEFSNSFQSEFEGQTP